MPVSANSAVAAHLAHLGIETISTRIGSPYVIQAMQEAAPRCPGIPRLRYPLRRQTKNRENRAGQGVLTLHCLPFEERGGNPHIYPIGPTGSHRIKFFTEKNVVIFL